MATQVRALHKPPADAPQAYPCAHVGSNTETHRGQPGSSHTHGDDPDTPETHARNTQPEPTGGGSRSVELLCAGAHYGQSSDLILRVQGPQAFSSSSSPHPAPCSARGLRSWLAATHGHLYCRGGAWVCVAQGGRGGQVRGLPSTP